MQKTGTCQVDPREMTIHTSESWIQSFLRRLISFQQAIFVLKKSLHVWREGGLVVLEQAIYSLCTLLTSILLARAISKVQYGFYALGMSLVFVTEVIQRSIIAVPYTVLSSGKEDIHGQQYLGNTLLQHLAISILFFLGSAFSALVLNAMERPYSNLVFLFGILAVCSHFRTILRCVLLAQMRYRDHLILSSMIGLILVLALLILYTIGQLTILTTCVTHSLGCLMYGFLVLRKSPFAIHWPAFFSDWAGNWRFGRWILLATCANAVGIRFLPWLTLHYWNCETVATVAALTTIVCMVRPALQASSGYLTPKLTRQMRWKGLDATRRITLTLVGIFGLAGLGYIVSLSFAGYWFVQVVYSGKYETSTMAMITLSTAMAAKSANVPISSFLAATHQPKALTVMGITSSIGCLALGLLIVPLWGVVGATTAVAVNHLISFAIGLTFLLCKEISTKLKYSGEEK
ncbi:MAG: hypothetical protein JXA82_19135 [Sedimentisphaerales bacterium]|nr:hypothetical protein [Sedimentisphaerales bacterium]